MVVDTRRNLTKHFTIDEVAYSRRAITLGIDNTMPDIYFNNALNVAKFILEPIRLHFGQPIIPSSWYRCERLNNAVGSKPTSQHRTASAVDISIHNVSDESLMEYVVNNLMYDQVILEPLWVHISYISGGRKEALVFDGENYRPYQAEKL